MAEDPTVLAAIRSVAEQYVAEHLPDEQPYFSMIWEKYIAGKQAGEPALQTTPSFTCSLSFGKSRKLDLVAPAVILAIEATIAELGTSLSECSQDDMQTAICEAAKALGASAKAAKQMAKKIAPKLHKEYVSSFFSYEPHSSTPMQVSEGERRWSEVLEEYLCDEPTHVVWSNDAWTKGAQGYDASIAEISHLREAKNDYHLFIDGDIIEVKARGRNGLEQVTDRKLSSVHAHLLTIFLRYRNDQIPSTHTFEKVFPKKAVEFGRLTDEFAASELIEAVSVINSKVLKYLDGITIPHRGRSHRYRCSCDADAKFLVIITFDRLKNYEVF